MTNKLQHYDNAISVDILYGEGFILDEKFGISAKYNLQGEIISNKTTSKPAITNSTYSYNVYEYNEDYIYDYNRVNFEQRKEDKRIIKLSSCRKMISDLKMPDNVVFEGEVPVDGSEQYFFDHDLYGEPVLTHAGDVIAQHVTPTSFNVLKWTWVDSPDDPKGGPDAPADLKVAPATTGLSVTWTASPQDPGCVEGYEVERSATSGGIFSNLTTTAPGVVKYSDTSVLPGSSAFYRVRAKSTCGSSPYTAEVSGKRP